MFRVLCFALEELAAVVGRAVQVRGNDPFHGFFVPFRCNSPLIIPQMRQNGKEKPLGQQRTIAASAFAGSFAGSCLTMTQKTTKIQKGRSDREQCAERAAAFSRDKEKPQGILSDSRGFFCRIVGKMQAGRALKSGSSAEILK